MLGQGERNDRRMDKMEKGAGGEAIVPPIHQVSIK